MRIRHVLIFHTNRPGYFQYNNVFETGISDFHLLIVTQLKMAFKKSYQNL